jgi:hypothetical protein
MMPAVAALAGLALCSPAVFRGWKLDDFLQRFLLVGDGKPPQLFATMHGYFDFIVPETINSWKDVGVVPWWTDDLLRLSFFRPVASFSHWIDYRLWPDSPMAMHAHSLLWYALACAVVGIVYRRFLGATWAAGLAGLLFAVDALHKTPVEWIANRNVLIALVAGGLAIATHDRWRREKWRPGAIVAPVCFVFSLLSAEAGVATGAYLVAHALFLESASFRRRGAAIAPYVAILVTWRLIYHGLGFGAFGSDLYVDPGREPLRFVSALVERAPVLLFGQIGRRDPIEYNFLSQAGAGSYQIAAWGSLGIVAVLLLPLLRRDRMVRFWATGAALSVVPFCSMGIPSGRLLVFCSIGAAALWARLLQVLIGRHSWCPRTVVWRAPAWALAIALLVIHGILSPYNLASGLLGPDRFQRVFEQAIDFASDEGIAERVIVIANPPCSFFLAHHRALRSFQGLELPRQLHVLGPGHRAVEVTRVDEYTVSVRPDHGYFLHPHQSHQTAEPIPYLHPVNFFGILDRTYRGSASPIVPGQRFHTPGLTAEIVSVTDDGRPAEALLRFDVPLGDPTLYWTKWDWESFSYSRFSPPSLGQTVRIPGPF